MGTDTVMIYTFLIKINPSLFCLLSNPPIVYHWQITMNPSIAITIPLIRAIWTPGTRRQGDDNREKYLKISRCQLMDRKVFTSQAGSGVEESKCALLAGFYLFPICHSTMLFVVLCQILFRQGGSGTWNVLHRTAGPPPLGNVQCQVRTIRNWEPGTHDVTSTTMIEQ